MSEFIQGPLPDKDSKSSKFSSHDNLTNLSPPTDIQGAHQNSGVYQNMPKDQSYQQEGLRKKEANSRDFDSSASWTGKENVILYRARVLYRRRAEYSKVLRHAGFDKKSRKTSETACKKIPRTF